MAAHAVTSYADGSFAIPTLPRSLADHTKHARHYGTEAVYESAEAEGHGPRTLARLRIELDAIDGKPRQVHGFTVKAKRRRRSSEETKAAAEALSVEGLVPAAIASKLGIGEKRTRELLRSL